MDKIKCEQCGKEILVLPDLAEMAKAIKNHLDKYHKNSKDRAKLCSRLSQQIIEITSKIK